MRWRIVNNDDIFLAIAMENGILNKEELFDAGISDDDYFNLTDEAIDKLEIYFNKKKT